VRCVVAKLRSAALAAFVVFGGSAGAAHAKDPPLLSLTPEHFRDTATVKDGPGDAVATISTENGYVEHTGPLHMVWHDEFLSAVIDKKTGGKSLQVHEAITYSGPWRFYQAAVYQGTDGPRREPAAQISKEAVNCPVGDCTYTEHVAFAVDEDLLRGLAAGYVPGKPAIWQYKIAAKTGPEFSGGLSNAEIAGFLARLDAYRNEPALERPSEPPAAKANAIVALGKLDLGIAGISVSAGAEHPNRAGILIIAVNGGSVAQKSGLIVGDILYEFNGRPVKSVAELQAALAAGAANAAIPIKLYRGLDPVAMSAQF
jgi:PDZ domain